MLSYYLLVKRFHYFFFIVDTMLEQWVCMKLLCFSITLKMFFVIVVFWKAIKNHKLRDFQCYARTYHMFHILIFQQIILFLFENQHWIDIIFTCKKILASAHTTFRTRYFIITKIETHIIYLMRCIILIIMSSATVLDDAAVRSSGHCAGHRFVDQRAAHLHHILPQQRRPRHSCNLHSYWRIDLFVWVLDISINHRYPNG